MILLQLSAANGPDECCLAVYKLLAVVLKEAELLGLEIKKVEEEPASKPNTHKSVLLSVNGEGAALFADSWRGSILWICQSPFRKLHKRKNWFIGGEIFELQESNSTTEIKFEACRSSGPGGQHANKTSSAIRATHIETGITVKVQSERSQHANKRLAKILIRHKLDVLKGDANYAERNRRHEAHGHVERGSPVRVFKGDNFIHSIPPDANR